MSKKTSNLFVNNKKNITFAADFDKQNPNNLNKMPMGGRQRQRCCGQQTPIYKIRCGAETVQMFENGCLCATLQPFSNE